MTKTKAISGTIENAVLSNDFENWIERSVITLEMQDIANLNNEAVSTLIKTKDPKLRGELISKIKNYHKDIENLQEKLNSLEQVAN